MKEASAPGKLFLIGEYAVLEGSPAILSAVPQRAKVSIEKGDSTVRSCTASEETFNANEVPILTTLVECLQKNHYSTPDLSNLSITLDTSEFFRDGRKVGLGSSAALTAALVKALAGDIDVNDQVALAIECHQMFQGGVGSGADVALAILDQDIVFEPGDTPKPVKLPDDFHQLCIWTGESASTADFIRAINDWKAANSTSYEQLITEMKSTVGDACSAIDTRNGSEFIQCLAIFGEQLKNLSDVSGIEAYSSAHLHMRKQVELADCIYKPSGAGGGDFGIAVSTERERLAGLQQELEKDGVYSFFLDRLTNP